MSSYFSRLFLILLSFVAITLSKQTYTFKIDVSPGSCLCYPITEDPLYFRLCNNALCSTFTSIPNGLSSGLHTYKVITPYDYGSINKIQIVHTGDDRLCLNWVEVDGSQYDWGINPYCWQGDTGATCSTLTVTSTNDWDSSATNPCEFASEFDDTYIPTPIPTQPTTTPTSPSKPPTRSPTPAPNYNPTTDPTIDPTHDPTKPTIGPSTDPTLEPTIEPTSQPTLPPTQEPTKLTKSPTHNPTAAPFGSANVDPDTTTTTNYDIDSQNGTEDDAAEMEETTRSFNKFNELMIGICAFLALVITISFIDAKWCRINDYHRVTALIMAIFQLLDMAYDCLFCIKITSDPDYSVESPLFTLLLLSIAFIVIPTLITLIQLHFELKEWKHNDEISKWIFDNAVLLYILSAICGSSFVAVRICCSNLFNLSHFDMPLSQMQESTFYTKRVYSSVMLENVPQLILQTVYLFVFVSSSNNDIVYASMAFSMLSIIISILSILTQRNVLKSRDYITIDFDVKSDTVSLSSKRCRNRYKTLRKHLSDIFGINSNMIEMQKASQIPKGLRVHIIIHINNTKAIDTNCEKLIVDANQTGELGKILKESWSLSTLPMIGNIKYEKYDSQERMDNTVTIKTMSEQIKNNDLTMAVNTSSIKGNQSDPILSYPNSMTNKVEMVSMHGTNSDDILADINPGEHDNNTGENNEAIPPVIPPVVVTIGGDDMHNTEDSDDSDDEQVTTVTSGK